jgi:hypothetical protein
MWNGLWWYRDLRSVAKKRIRQQKMESREASVTLFEPELVPQESGVKFKLPTDIRGMDKDG